jgi:hypothetical protein
VELLRWKVGLFGMKQQAGRPSDRSDQSDRTHGQPALLLNGSTWPEVKITAIGHKDHDDLFIQGKKVEL